MSPQLDGRSHLLFRPSCDQPVKTLPELKVGSVNKSRGPGRTTSAFPQLTYRSLCRDKTYRRPVITPSGPGRNPLCVTIGISSRTEVLGGIGDRMRPWRCRVECAWSGHDPLSFTPLATRNLFHPCFCGLETLQSGSSPGWKPFILSFDCGRP